MGAVAAVKKICFVGHFLYNHSGASRISVLLCNELCSKYDVHLLSLCGGDAPICYSTDSRVHKNAFNLNPSHRLRQIFVESFFKLKKYFHDNDFDIVFIIGSFLVPIFAALRPFSKFKIVFCDHESLVNQDWKSLMFKRIACMVSEKIVVLTNRTKKDYQKKFGLDDEKVECIYNFIDDGIYKHLGNGYDENSKMIISVGRCSPEKGWDMAVDVGKPVFAKHSDWQWHLYGGGEDYEKTARKIKDCGLEKNMILKGATNDIYARYPDYAMCVLTSYREGLPLVLIEAKIHGLPIVSFDCPTGPSEIVLDGEDGYLIECYDKKKMVEKICFLIENLEVRKIFSARSGKELSKFSKDVMVKKWIDLIEILN
jgi:glycosyltransferase involved in cell wall biosynthesis